MDVMSKTYDVTDYLEILREQMTEKKFIATQRAVYLSSWRDVDGWCIEKHRNYKGLLDLYKDEPQEQHLFGYMYLEGLGVPRDYAKAWYYFDNSSNPLFNSSYCVFGKGIIHFYGNIRCLIEWQVSVLTRMKPPGVNGLTKHSEWIFWILYSCIIMVSVNFTSIVFRKQTMTFLLLPSNSLLLLLIWLFVWRN